MITSLSNDIGNIRHWTEKTIVTFGDSRTWYDGHNYLSTTKSAWRGQACKGYQSFMKDMLGTTNIVNQGVSGDTSVQICGRVRQYDFTGVDAVLLAGGINDFINVSSVGVLKPIGSTFDTNTIYGAWQSAIEYILTNYPSVKIYMTVPPFGWSSDVPYPYDLAMVKSEVADLYGIPCKNLYKTLGFNMVNRDYYYVDDLTQVNGCMHFNNYGNEAIGRVLSDFINGTTSDIDSVSKNEFVSELKDNFGLVKVENVVRRKYIKTNVNAGTTVDLTEQSSNGYSYLMFACAPNDKIMLTGTGGNNPRLWAFVDSEYKLIQKSDNAVSASGLVIIAPADTAYCIINSEMSALGACYITPDWYGVKASIISNTQADATSVPSNSDLNDYTISGDYKVTTTAIVNSLSNRPTNSSGRLIVMTLNSNSNIFQVYISVKGNIFTREKDSNGWSDWASSTYALKLRSTDSEAIAENSDLNDFTSAGNYYVATTAIAQSLVNYPAKKSGRLIVMTLNSASNIFQIYITSEGVVYTREKDNSGWSAWSTRTEPLNLKYEDTTSIPSGADLNDYTTPGNFKVTTTAIARSLVNAPMYIGGDLANSSGRLIVMSTMSANSLLQIYINAKGEIFTRRRDSVYWSYWEKKASEADTSVYATKGAYNAMQALIAQSNYNIAFANSFTPLGLKNYLGNTQNVHPKVLYFKSGFGGHKYWMCYTPYPYSDDINENPCVAYSDDGYTWKNISGNPLDTAEAPNYNSDGHLVYRADTGVMELWYRYFERDTEIKTMYRKTSTDGVTWSQKELIKTFSASEDCASQAVIFDGTNYLIWGVSAGTTIDFYTAPANNITSWTKVRTLNTAYYDGNTRVYPWHIDVIMDGNTYVILAMCRNTRNVSDGVWSLFITTSSDNITYSTPVKVVGGADSWDKYMYRSTIVKVSGKYRIYYSACSTKSTSSIYNNAYWGMGITESDELTTGYIGKFE